MLRITLHINAEQIGDYEVRNVTPAAEPSKAATGALGGRPCQYEVRAIDDEWQVDSPPMFTVMHRRGDGAEALAAAVLRQLSRSRSLPLPHSRREVEHE